MERAFEKIVSLLGALLIAVTSVFILVVPAYLQTDKSVDFFSAAEIANNIKNLELNMTSIVYVKDANGKWQEYQRLHGDENRIWVSIDKAPQTLIDAFVAIEDERFFEHEGVDWKRTTAAAGNILFHYNAREFGGSTITQQLIKNITSDNERDAQRKFREIVRAILVEKILSKNQILEAYLNTVSLGNGICGIQVAANYYFNKELKQLTLAQCASLAAITQNPVRYNPVGGKEENVKRRNLVLKKMWDLGKINKKEYEKACKEKLVLDNSQKKHYEAEVNSYFMDALIDQVIEDIAAEYHLNTDIASRVFYNSGLRIYATLQTDIQDKMESVYQNVGRYFSQTAVNSKGERVNVQSAMTVMDYGGHIMGIVGGVGEKTTNRGLNRATDYPRQPGSTMKPIGVYALAIDKDIVNYTSTVLDQPVDHYFADGRSGPHEWYGYYKGNISVNYAIRKSANTIPVRLLQEVGIDDSYDFLKNKLHCNHLVELDKNPASLALGGCTYGLTTTESAAAYAIFGNQGVYHKPTTYYKVEKANGKPFLTYDKKGEQVISKASATIMNHLLQEVVYQSEGTGGGIAGFSPMKAYAKTGTSSESMDLWMVAGSPYYIGAVYYGFDEKSTLWNQSAAATIWRDVMSEIHRGLPIKEFEDSDDVYQQGIGYYKKGTSITGYGTQTGGGGTEVSQEEETDSSKTASKTSSKTSTQETSSETSSETPASNPDESSGTSDTSSNPSSGDDPPDGGNSSASAEPQPGG